MVIERKTTLGSLMAFTSLSSCFMGPIGRLVNLQLSIQEAGISLKRISEIYEVEREQDEEQHKINIEKIDGDIGDENGQPKIMVKIMIQLKNLIHNIDKPYEIKNQI